MGDRRKYRYFACDFETTVYPHQEEQLETEVWASAVVELDSDDVKIFHSIDETWEYFKSLKCNIIAYYHNLRFDGSFWLNYFLLKLNFRQACIIHNGSTPSEYDGTDVHWKEKKDMFNNTFLYHISAQGLWYNMIVKVSNKIIEFRDSYKLIPFSIKKIGRDFQTKHQKLTMEYSGYRYAGCVITEKEREYIANDVLVLKEALEFMFDENHKRLTIGSCCLHEYKQLAVDLPLLKYDDTFPNVYELYIDDTIYGVNTVGRYIWRAYHGGWCYLVKGKENKRYHNGVTADVNSLYPFQMHSSSGNRYPFGIPKFWHGNYIPEDALIRDRFYYIRIRTRFYLKKNKLPFIQIKGSLYYKSTECLTSSDRVNPKTGEKLKHFLNFDNEIEDTRVTMTLTMMDFELIKEHYNLVDFEILDGCYFNSAIGLFDCYIDKYMEIKKTSKGAKRALAKLFLNNLYGKMAAVSDSSFKFAYLRDDNTIGFYQIEEDERVPGYIPIGAAITSYARCYTIRAAQKNYHGVDKPGFIYADTDSIHCDLPASQLKGIRIHKTDLGAWDLESQWDYGIFVRQKTYIEHEGDAYNIKCAGMPQLCKNIFEYSLRGEVPEKDEDGNDIIILPEQKEFLYDKDGKVIKRDIEDFKVGLKIFGKLLPKMIKGGILLVATTYELK